MSILHQVQLEVLLGWLLLLLSWFNLGRSWLLSSRLGCFRGLWLETKGGSSLSSWLLGLGIGVRLRHWVGMGLRHWIGMGLRLWFWIRMGSRLVIISLRCSSRCSLSFNVERHWTILGCLCLLLLFYSLLFLLCGSSWSGSCLLLLGILWINKRNEDWISLWLLFLLLLLEGNISRDAVMLDSWLFEQRSVEGLRLIKEVRAVLEGLKVSSRWLLLSLKWGVGVEWSMHMWIFILEVQVVFVIKMACMIVILSDVMVLLQLGCERSMEGFIITRLKMWKWPLQSGVKLHSIWLTLVVLEKMGVLYVVNNDFRAVAWKTNKLSVIRHSWIDMIVWILAPLHVKLLMLPRPWLRWVNTLMLSVVQAVQLLLPVLQGRLMLDLVPLLIVSAEKEVIFRRVTGECGKFVSLFSKIEVIMWLEWMDWLSIAKRVLINDVWGVLCGRCLLH